MRLLTADWIDFTTSDQVNIGLPQLQKRTNQIGQAKPSKALGFGMSEFPPLEPPQKSIFLASPKTVTPAIPLISKLDATKSNLSVSKLASTLVEEDEILGTPVHNASNDAAAEPRSEAPETVSSSKAKSKASIILMAGEFSTIEGSSSVLQSENSPSSTTTPPEPPIVGQKPESPADLSNKKHATPQLPPSLVRNLRTLRLITTIKAEDSHLAHSEIESASTANETSVSKIATQPSGNASTKQPSTPINELISETVSLTSASVSRPGTPNLSSRIHIGPTVMKSKNQIKKERQARAKQNEEARSEEVSVVDEEIQAPIIGRKKKAKKIAFTKPKPVAKLPSTGINVAPEDAVVAESGRVAEQPTFVPLSVDKESIPTRKETHSVEDEPIDLKQRSSRPAITTASILVDLKNEGILDLADVEYYLNPSGLNTRLDVNTSNIFKYQASLELDEEEKDILDSGDSIAKQINPDEWAVILPDRSVLRHFTKEEACHYVDLKLELDQDSVNTFNGHDFPIDAWSSFTSNDVLSNLQIAPPFDCIYHNRPFTIFDTPEPLIEEFTATLLRPDGKDVSYGAMYPPRTQTENEEIESRMAMYTLEEAEQTVKASEELLLGVRKETEQLEKKLSVLVKKNRKILKDWC